MHVSLHAESIKSTEDLLPYITPMTQYLRELGVALAISEESAAIVDGPGAARSKCLSILQLWLSCTARPTWTLLCQRLRKVDIFTNLVTTIEADHKVLSTYGWYILFSTLAMIFTDVVMPKFNCVLCQYRY